MSDTRAINIIIAGIIIFLVIGAFYVFLTKATIEKQKDAIKGSAGTIQVDRLIAEWAYETDLHLPAKELGDSLTKWFKDRGFIAGSTTDFVSPIFCIGGDRNVNCNFAVGRSKQGTRTAYSKTIFVPTQKDVRKINMIGTVIYE